MAVAINVNELPAETIGDYGLYVYQVRVRTVEHDTLGVWVRANSIDRGIELAEAHVKQNTGYQYAEATYSSLVYTVTER